MLGSRHFSFLCALLFSYLGFLFESLEVNFASVFSWAGGIAYCFSGNLSLIFSFWVVLGCVVCGRFASALAFFFFFFLVFYIWVLWLCVFLCRVRAKNRSLRNFMYYLVCSSWELEITSFSSDFVSKMISGGSERNCWRKRRIVAFVCLSAVENKSISCLNRNVWFLIIKFTCDEPVWLRVVFTYAISRTLFVIHICIPFSCCILFGSAHYITNAIDNTQSCC